MLVENELKELQKFDSNHFRGKSHFEEVGAQNYLIFSLMYRYFKRIAGVGSGDYIYIWKSKGLSDKRIDSITASNYSITPELSRYGTEVRVKFSGSCLKQDKAAYNHETIVNIYIVYEISKNYNTSSYPTLENSLFGAVKLTKTADVDQYKNSGYGIGFDRNGEFTFGNGLSRNVIVFGVDLTNSSHANNKTNILVLGKDFTQEINGATLYTENLDSINFTENNKKFCVIMDIIVIYLLMVQKFINSEIVANPLCLGNISKEFSVDNMKKKKNRIKWICL